MNLLAVSEWSYIAGGYGMAVGTLVLLTISIIIRGRRIGRQVPPQERRWL